MAARLGEEGTLQRAHEPAETTGRRLRRGRRIRLHDGSPRAAIRAQTAGRAEEGGALSGLEQPGAGDPWSPARWYYARALPQPADDDLHQHVWRGAACFPDAALQRRLVIPARLVPSRGLARPGEVYPAGWHERLCLARRRGAAQIRTLRRASVQSAAGRQRWFSAPALSAARMLSSVRTSARSARFKARSKIFATADRVPLTAMTSICIRHFSTLLRPGTTRTR